MIELKVVFDITPALSSAISTVANAFNKKTAVSEELAKGLKGLAERERASQVPVQPDTAEPKKRKTKKADVAEPEKPSEPEVTAEPKATADLEKPSEPEITAEPEAKQDTSEPEKAIEQTPEIEEKPAEAASDDPMQGMTVMQAAQKLLNEVKEADLDMVEVNKRVRAKASELGLSYGSVACLIKAVGYSEARTIALGE